MQEHGHIVIHCSSWDLYLISALVRTSLCIDLKARLPNFRQVTRQGLELILTSYRIEHDIKVAEILYTHAYTATSFHYFPD